MKDLVGTMLVHVYCMDMSELAWQALLMSCLYLCCFHRLQGKRWRDPVVVIGLFCCLAVAVYATVANRGNSHTQLPQLVPFHSYRAVQAGANPELYRSNFMNAALFYPAGLLGTSLLPKKWPGWCRCLLVTGLLGALSGGIEYLQYRYALGLCEIDDVIHNTAGALAGSLATVVLPWLFFRLWAALGLNEKE